MGVNSACTSRGASAADNAPAAGRYVNSSGEAVDENGKSIYIRTGASGSYSYTRAKGDPENAVDSKYRSDYNEEMILITSDTATITITDKRDGQLIVTENQTTGNMDENSRFGKLQRTVALICEPKAIGTYEIKIEDATLDRRDVPRLDVGRTPAPITFTLHVTPATTPTIGTDAIAVTTGIERVPTDSDVEPVSALLTFPSSGTNTDYRIRYEVVRGSGTLYLGTLEEEHATPRTAISVHQSSNVYLNTNGTSNEVHISFAGEDRSAPRVTLIFEYKGQPVPTTRTAPPPQPLVQQVARLTISTSGDRHDADGNCERYHRSGDIFSRRIGYTQQYRLQFVPSSHHWHAYNGYTADDCWELYAFGN